MSRLTQNTQDPLELDLDAHVEDDVRRIPQADDFEALARHLMKPVPDYPIVAEGHLVWEIADWAAVRKQDKVRGPQFSCGGFDWNVLLFPKGSNDTILLYMEPHPHEAGNWHVCAQFALSIWNPAHPEAHFLLGSSHRFSQSETDWGFSLFITMRDLGSPKAGQTHAIMEDNSVSITGYVRVLDDSATGVLWHNFVDYDLKTSTGFVGLNNQGATCYLNSLLQLYFTTKVFRDLVFQIPTEGTKGVPLALQRIFYLLLLANQPVETMELTKLFGWDSLDAFTQHDVQELNRVLMDRLEHAMKGTNLKDQLIRTFVGKMKLYIRCVNVPYELSREEDFWDIQLNVKGFKNLRALFENYIEVEMLEGENKYQAGEEHGYQEAKKGVVFRSFPPVLHLQLKRFEYDFMVDDLVKIDDRYEFPDRINLAPYLDEELPAEVRGENWHYKLHGVLVHQGSISNGHYYAMIKPEAHSDTWLRFDDDKVWRVTPTQVFEENFGANERLPAQLRTLTRAEHNEYYIRRATLAYMLVYYREENLDDVLPAQLAPIPGHVLAEIERERAERADLERSKREALFYMHVKVVTAAHFAHYSGFDTYPDPSETKLYDPAIFDERLYPKVLKVKKDATLAALREMVAQELGHAEPFRLLTVKHRNNKTNRPDEYLPEGLETTPVSTIYSRCFKRKYDEMVFFVQEPQRELQNVSSEPQEPEHFDHERVVKRLMDNSHHSHSGDTLLFVKYYDIHKQELRGVTYVSLSQDDVVGLLEPLLQKALGLQGPFLYYEEISHTRIERLDPTLTLEKSELGNGDIVTVQLDAKLEHTVTSHYHFLLTRMHVKVAPFKASDEDEDLDFVEEERPKKLTKSADFWILTQSLYAELALAVAKALDTDPDFLRLFLVNAEGTRLPLLTKLELSQVFPKQKAVSSVTLLEYETLNITLREYENMRLVKISWLTSILQVHVFDLLMPKTSTVADVIHKLIAKLNIPEEQWSQLLVWAGQDYKYADLIRFDRSIDDIDPQYELLCGYFPAEVEILVSHDMFKRLDERYTKALDIADEGVRREFEMAQKYLKLVNIVPVFHFYKSTSFCHSRPFIFAIFPDEPFADTLERLRKKLGLGTQAFEKVRIALADINSKGRYLDPEKTLVLLDETSKFDSQALLALDHPDRNLRRPNPFDKGISIK